MTRAWPRWSARRSNPTSAGDGPMEEIRTRWGDKPYHSLDYHLRETFGEKVYRISLNAGCTCPNRDGTLGSRGCIFCSAHGSGDFAAAADASVTTQIEAARQRLWDKRHCRKYSAYFQAFTNTYGPYERLRSLYFEAVCHPDVAVLSVATRPDCLPLAILELLEELSRIKPVWVELGLQTIHPATSSFLRSGFTLDCFQKAVLELKRRRIPVIVHVILGLPGETREMMLQTVDYLAALHVDGVKLQLLHVLTDTDLYDYYCSHPFPLLSREEYCCLIMECLEHLPQDVVIHRLTGDGPKALLAAPLWSCAKRTVLNEIHRCMKEHGSFQGRYRIGSGSVPGTEAP